jgi:homoserine O-acetyltransferase
MTLAEEIEHPLCRPQERNGPKLHSQPAGRIGARDVFAPIPDDFRLESGERLGQRRIVGRLHGREGGPLVVVSGGISADRFVSRTPTGDAGWWSRIVGSRAPVDTTRCQVLAFDFAPEARAGERPVTITTRDQARLLALLLDAAGAPRVDAFVGASYGGMVALAFGALFPRRVGQLVILAAAHRPHPQAAAWRGIQRRILQFALDAGRPEDGVALARQLAMTTYRTPEELGERFDTIAPAAAGDPYPVCEYLIAQGAAYRSRMTAERWLSLSDSIDRHDIQPEDVQVPTTVVGFTSDRLTPIEDVRELAARLPLLWRFVEAPSLYGHDAFLKEEALVGRTLSEALKEHLA